jgi:hypothetical protein
VTRHRQRGIAQVADNLAVMTVAADLDDLRSQFLTLAELDFAGYCPIYDRIARSLAADDDALRLITEQRPGSTRTALLFLGATHDLVLRHRQSELGRIYRGECESDPWPPFRELLFNNHREIASCMATRTTQTNEVGRSANLLAIYASVSREMTARGDSRPVAIIEIGPSAGLNLLVDRYRIDYLADGAIVASAGVSDSGVQITCELRNAQQFPGVDGMHEIALRTGLDPNPIDVTDPDEARWLQACVWPGVPDRPERLAAAIASARTDPPLLHRGSAVDDLQSLLETIPNDVLPIVTSTWVLAYLSRTDRQAVCDIIDTRGATRDIVLVTGESPTVTPWVPAIDADLLDTSDGTPTVFGVRSWFDGQCHTSARAVCHPHGRWMIWPTEEKHG